MSFEQDAITARRNRHRGGVTRLDGEPGAVRIITATFRLTLPEPQRSRIAFSAPCSRCAFANCTFERFGEDDDGGYLMCGNLLRYTQVAYSYGISGYDGWGCEMAARLASTTHQYDCFNLSVPVCSAGRTVFHPLCVAGRPSVDAEGRRFSRLSEQIAANGDGLRRLSSRWTSRGPSGTRCSRPRTTSSAGSTS